MFEVLDYNTANIALPYQTLPKILKNFNEIFPARPNHNNNLFVLFSVEFGNKH